LAILTSVKAQEEGKGNPEQPKQQPAVPVRVIIFHFKLAIYMNL